MKVTYSKVEAAKEQLDLAIRLYFEDEDPAPIQTLCAASHKIISNLLNVNGLRSTIDELVELTKPEKKKEAYRIFHRVSNYLKHAEYDGDEVLEFDSELNDLSLFMAVRDYQILGGPMTINMALFKLWFMPQNPELFRPAPDLKGLLEDFNLRLKNVNKKFFFENAPKIADERGIDLIGRSE